MVFINSSVCWYPDGETSGSDVDPPAIPCDPSAPVSACCSNTGVSCLNKGLCFGLNGGIYRGGCTDKTFKAAECGNPDPICIGSDYNSGNVILTKCGDGSYGCKAKDCDSGNTFELPEMFVQQVNITGLLASPAALASTAASASTSTSPSPNGATSCPATTSNSSSKFNNVAIGAGVGVPLGVLLLITLATTLWYRRKWITATKHANSPVPAYRDSGQPRADMKLHPGHASELSEQGVAELHSRPNVHELGQK